MHKVSREEIEELVYDMFGDEYPILIADNLDDAFVGIIQRGNDVPYLAYDYWKVVDIIYKSLEEEHGEETEFTDAIDYVEYNIISAWEGPHTPAFIRR
jgi:hypothetical protein